MAVLVCILLSLKGSLYILDNSPLSIFFFQIFSPSLWLVFSWSEHCISWKVKSLNCVRLFEAPWTIAYQVPLSMGVSECWSGLPFPSPRDLPDPGIEPGSPSLQADALPSEPLGKI